jgi:hypothetical protein
MRSGRGGKEGLRSTFGACMCVRVCVGDDARPHAPCLAPIGATCERNPLVVGFEQAAVDHFHGHLVALVRAMEHLNGNRVRSPGSAGWATRGWEWVGYGKLRDSWVGGVGGGGDGGGSTGPSSKACGRAWRVWHSKYLCKAPCTNGLHAVEQQLRGVNQPVRAHFGDHLQRSVW